MSFKLRVTRYNHHIITSSYRLIISFFLLSAFCFQPFSVQAQVISDEIFGEYVGDTEISIPMFDISQTIPDVPVQLVNTGDDYILKIEYLYIMEDVQMNNIVITPFGDGYKLTRTESINFTIPEITIPAIPPYFNEEQTFTDVPVVITLENAQIVNFVLTFDIKAIATITYYLGPIPIPIPITVNINFEGMLFSPPVITTPTLPNGTVNEPYYAILEATGITPITWSIMNGQGELPTGLQLDEQTGEITGIPTEDNIFQFVVIATNSSGYEAVLMSIEIEEEKDTTGIATPAFSLLRVFPNPTTGELRMENGEWRINNVEIFDVSGRKQTINYRKSEIGKSEIEINISHLPAGNYLLKIHTEKGQKIEKIIKN